MVFSDIFCGESDRRGVCGVHLSIDGVEVASDLIFADECVVQYHPLVLVFVVFEADADGEIGDADDVVVFEFGFVDGLIVEICFVGGAEVFDDPVAVFGGVEDGMLP